MARILALIVFLRWSIALIVSVGTYRRCSFMRGHPRQSWPSVLPGAIVATVLWF